MNERRARWESSLRCTVSDVLLTGGAGLGALVLALTLRHRASTALIVAAGMAAGVVAHACVCLALGRPLLVRRIEWARDPESASTTRLLIAASLSGALVFAAATVIFLAFGRAWQCVTALAAGIVLSASLIALLQRLILDRDFVRYLGSFGH